MFVVSFFKVFSFMVSKFMENIYSVSKNYLFYLLRFLKSQKIFSHWAYPHMYFT